MTPPAQTSSPPQESVLRRFAPLIGFLAGAFLFPCAFFVFCVAVLHDRGGILIYPLAGMVAAPFGLLIGYRIRGVDRRFSPAPPNEPR